MWKYETFSHHVSAQHLPYTGTEQRWPQVNNDAQGASEEVTNKEEAQCANTEDVTTSNYMLYRACTRVWY
jgi:hypothetical protein